MAELDGLIAPSIQDAVCVAQRLQNPFGTRRCTRLIEPLARQSGPIRRSGAARRSA
jgi:hypothetical protein